MRIFVYSAAQQDGKVVKGEREAENEVMLARMLRQEQLFLLDATPKDTAGGGGILHFNVNTILDRVRPITVVDKMFFTRNLAVMIGAGIPLARAMEALSDESANAKFRETLVSVNASVIKGTSFAESLRQYPKVFSDLFVNMVEVGEASGKLTLILRLLARQMKKDYDLKKRVRGAMIYPAIILIVLGGVGTFMMLYIVPTLSQTIKELGVALPLSTRIIIGVSDLIVNYALFVAAGVVAAAFAFWRLILRTARGKELFDRMVLHTPIFGKLIKQFNMARFCRTLSYLLTSGIAIVRSLEIAASVLGNAQYRFAVEHASKEIQKGRQLNDILSAYPYLFSPTVIHMMKVGEETGKIAEMLLRLALFFEEDVQNTTKNLSTIIEPVLMVVIGAVVGFFAVSMLQPIYGSLGNL